MEPSPKLPVKPLAKEAFLLPFKHLQVFVRLAAVPVGLTILSQFIGGFLASVTGHWYFNGVWLGFLDFCGVPFFVGWTKLAVEGTASVADRSYFTFGRVEIRYLVAQIILSVLLVGPVGICLWWAYDSNWAAAPIAMTVTALVIVLWVGWRFMFLLTALALDRYAGVNAAWRQTKGVVLRILGVITLSSIPISFARGIVGRIIGSSVATDVTSVLTLRIYGIATLFLSTAVFTGAIALCYRFKIAGSGRPE